MHSSSASPLSLFSRLGSTLFVSTLYVPSTLSLSITQPPRDVAQKRLSGPTVNAKFDDRSPHELWPLALVFVKPMSVQGPLGELELNIWPGTISPTDSTYGLVPVGATSAVT